MEKYVNVNRPLYNAERSQPMGVFAAQLTPVGQGRADIEAGIGRIADQWRGRVEGDWIVVGVVESVPRQTAANANTGNQFSILPRSII